MKEMWPIVHNTETEISANPHRSQSCERRGRSQLGFTYLYFRQI